MKQLTRSFLLVCLENLAPKYWDRDENNVRVSDAQYNAATSVLYFGTHLLECGSVIVQTLYVMVPTTVIYKVEQYFVR